MSPFLVISLRQHLALGCSMRHGFLGTTTYYYYYYYYYYYPSHTTQLRTVKGVSACCGLPASHQERPQQTLHISGNLWGKGILPSQWILRNTHRASPSSPNLSSQKRLRDVQLSVIIIIIFQNSKQQHKKQIKKIKKENPPKNPKKPQNNTCLT